MRNIIATPKSVVNLTPEASEVLMYSNFIEAGLSIKLDEIPAQTLFYVQYYLRRKKAKDRENEFKILFEGLSRMFK